MQFPVSSQVWVKCDDGEWWPAKTRAVTADLRPFMGETEDSCVEFYHDVGQLYPVSSTDPLVVQPFHREAAQRGSEERTWFSRAATRDAVSRALRDSTSYSAPSFQREESVDSLAGNGTAPAEPTSFSADELRNIRQLLGAVSGPTAAQLLQSLSAVGQGFSAGSVRWQGEKERASRKRHRTGAAPVAQFAPPTTLQPEDNLAAPAASPFPATQHIPVRNRAPKRNARSRGEVDVAGGNGRNPSALDFSGTPPSLSSSGGRGTEQDGPTTAEEGEEPSTGEFTQSADPAILEVIRAEVFENPELFALSPIYRFLDILGATIVENANVHTTLPSPRAVRHAPGQGFDPGRRVLLVALSEEYSHTNGWMQPIKLGDTTLAMRLAVNGVSVEVPSNWPLTPGKEASAIRTAPVADITDLVMSTEQELFSLDIGFTTIPEDTDLWSGVVACIFAEEVPIATVGEQIVSNYRKSARSSATRSSRSSAPRNAHREDAAVNVTEGCVKIQCPLTTLPMVIPVRGVSCEHLQCMELAALLVHCVRSNLWNCPLCGSSTKPLDVWVNYRLKDWLQEHHAELSRVDYVTETAVGKPIKAHFRYSHAANAVDVEEVTDSD